MSARFRPQLMEPTVRRVVRIRQPNRTLDVEGVIRERLRSKKNSRSGQASNVTAKSNELITLLSDHRNLQEVKEKLVHVDAAFQKLTDTHRDYAGEIRDEAGMLECQAYLERRKKNFSTFRKRIVDWIAAVEDKLVAESLRVDSDVKPEDSISCAGTPTLSRVSKHPSRASSRGSRTSSVAFARAKEAAKVAELQAEITMLEKRQALEERKLRLRKEELRLDLEAKIAKSAAKERAFASITPRV